MRIAICDDDQQELNQMVEAVRGWDRSRQPECFTNGADFLQAASMKKPFSIVFLDVYMPGQNGITVAEELQRISPETDIVFVTTSQEHAVDAFSLHALHYLVKPVTVEDIAEAFRRMTELHTRRRPVIRFTSGYENYSVYVDEICYLQSSNHATEIAVTDGNLIRCWKSLGELAEELGDGFLRLNRGTIVNMDYIRRLGTESCLLQDGMKFELSRRERWAIRAAYHDYLFRKLEQREDFGEETV